MRGDASLLTLISDVSILFGAMNFLIIAISENNADILFYDDLYPLHNVAPISYNVTLTLDQQLQKERCHIYFDGQCNIEIYIKHSTYDIKLDAQEPNVAVYYAYVVVGAKKHRAEIKQEGKSSLILHLSLLIHGSVKLEIIFGSCVYDTDVHRILDMKQEFYMWLLATHLLPTRTGALFPCFPNIEYKATFRIDLIVDDVYNALCNTMRQDVVYEGLRENMKKLSFRQTDNMSTYDIAFVVYDKTFLRFDFIRSRPEVARHIEFVQTIAYDVTQDLRNTWEIFRMLLIPNYVAIAGLPYNAVTKPGLNILREDALLYKSDTDTFATKIEVVRLVSRVVVHEMLNNVVSPNRWEHLWINEGIAMLLGQYIVDKLLSELRLFDLFIVQFHQESLRLDTPSIMGPVRPIVKSGKSIHSLFSFSHYIKAPVILNMLRRVISDEIFWKGVQNYLTNNMEASPAKFCKAMERTIKETNATAHVPISNVSEVMDTLANQTQYHVLNITQETNSSRINIHTKSDTKLRWDYLTLTMSTQSELNFALNRDKIYGVWVLKEGEHSLYYFQNPNKNDWIMFNSQQLGYYRVMYQEENWRKIADYLNSENYTNIPVLNRAQIMDDAFHFLLTDQMHLSIFLNLTNYLQQERDYVVWYPVFKGFEFISGYLPYENSTYIKEKFVNMLNKLLLQNGILNSENMMRINKNDFSDCLGQEVAKWACNFGSSTCKYFVKYIMVSKKMENLRTRVLPWWRKWVYCTGLMKMENNIWEELLFTYLNEDDNKMLEFLACPEDPQIIRTYISLIQYDKRVRDHIKNKGRKMFINIFHSIVERHANTILVLEYILKNFDSVIPRQIGRIVALTDLINHVYSEKHLGKIVEYAKVQKFRGFQLVIRKANLVRAAQIKNHQQRFKNLGKK